MIDRFGFWQRVFVKGENDCWEWQGARHDQGYGLFTKRKQPFGTRYAHRIAWILTHGSIPNALNVLHTCDNPPCCNPAHLFLGTQLDNIRDMERKGRARRVHPPHGDRHNKSKLTSSSVREIRACYRKRDPVYGAQALSKKYGVLPKQIIRVANGEVWKGIR